MHHCAIPMKSFKIFLFLYIGSSTIYSQAPMRQSRTIFSPAPLIKFNKDMPGADDYRSYIKKIGIPITCCYYLSLQSNNLLMDIIEHPAIAAFLGYITINYFNYVWLKKQEKKTSQELTEIIEYLFYLLVIGHGVYNQIITVYQEQDQTLDMQLDILEDLDFFLKKTYSTWHTLFIYHEERYGKKYLYAYNVEQINFFEVLQATTNIPEVLPLVAQFYNNNNSYDYEPILHCLEFKLKAVNHKMNHIISS